MPDIARPVRGRAASPLGRTGVERVSRQGPRRSRAISGNIAHVTDGDAESPTAPSVSIDGPAWALFLGRRRPRWRALATWIISAALTALLAAVSVHFLTVGLSVRGSKPQMATVVSVSGQGTREPSVRVTVPGGSTLPLTLLFEPTPEVGAHVQVAMSPGPPPYAVLTATNWFAWALLSLMAAVAVGCYAVWQFVLWRRITARDAANG